MQLNSPGKNIVESIHFRLFLILVAVLLVFRLFIPASDQLVYKIVSDLLLLSVVVFL